LITWAEALNVTVPGREPLISLLISPSLSPNDIEAIGDALTPESRARICNESVETYIRQIFEAELADSRAIACRNLLAWLIATEKLEIRFALPNQFDETGIFHEKIGIFHFANGDKVAFTGSANETLSGHSKNWETVDVFRSWVDGDRDRVQTKELEFQEAWSNNLPGLQVLKLSKRSLRLIERAAPSTRPKLSPVSDHFPNSYILRHHQQDAVTSWTENNGRGLFDMCTGSGKTIAAIECIRLTLTQNPQLFALVACPRKVLVDQWRSELSRWAPELRVVPAFGNVAKYHQLLKHILKLKQTDSSVHYVILTTYQSLFSGHFIYQLSEAQSNGKNALLVADEAHSIATPEKLNNLEKLDPFFIKRLALTATPEIEGFPERTRRLLAFFGGTIAKYTLTMAIREGVLCEYDYMPLPAFLDERLSNAYWRTLNTSFQSSDQVARLRSYEERRNIIRKSEVFMPIFEGTIDHLRQQPDGLDWSVVFSPPGRDTDDTKIVQKVKASLEKRFITCGTIVAGTKEGQRKLTLRSFRDRSFKVLLGIGCLDEGLDVPEIRRSFILYSVDREKQFIQRRGRVLRKALGKEYASIYDVIVLPQGSDLPLATKQKIIEKELRRYFEFARGSRNPSDAEKILTNALQIARGRI